MAKNVNDWLSGSLCNNRKGRGTKLIKMGGRFSFHGTDKGFPLVLNGQGHLTFNISEIKGWIWLLYEQRSELVEWTSEVGIGGEFPIPWDWARVKYWCNSMIIVMMVMNDSDCDDYDGHLLGVVGGCYCNVKMISGPLLPSDCKRLFLQVSLLTCTYLLFCFSKIEMALFHFFNVSMLRCCILLLVDWSFFSSADKLIEIPPFEHQMLWILWNDVDLYMKIPYKMQIMFL